MVRLVLEKVYNFFIILPDNPPHIGTWVIVSR
jgi:hypothetical protein